VQEDYVLAAHALGSSGMTIIRRHILRGLVGPLVVQATVMLAVAINTAAALNFLGLGVRSPQPDWGLMVSEGQRLVFDAPHVPVVPGVALALTVLSVNFLGDALRDWLDPRTRGV
jgi:peptide/nickel transport system permease protein